MIEVTKYRHQLIGVYGLGKTGISSINALISGGAEVIAWDDDESKRTRWLDNLDPIHLIHSPEKILLDPDDPKWKKITKLVLTPGIQINGNKSHSIVKFAKKINCDIVSDIELLFQTCKSAKYVAITGTNGKSTTTSLAGHLLKSAGVRCQVGGNIGMAVLDLEPLYADGVYVLELSSYQLDLINSTIFNISTLLNITEDHLDYHQTMDDYVRAKLRIFNDHTAGNVAIISVDNEINKEIYKNIDQYTKAKIIPISTEEIIQGGVAVINNKIYDFTRNQLEPEIFEYNNHLHLSGKHNHENLAAAYAIAINFINDKSRIIDSISSFIGLPHRSEYLGKNNNLTFINDSKATNATSTEKAFTNFNNIYWIAGGIEKIGGINCLESHFDKIKHAFLIGISENNFAKFLDGKVPYTKCGTLTNAFKEAIKKAKFEDQDITILFSPACASFDQWNNFEERGDTFKNLYKNFIQLKETV